MYPTWIIWEQTNNIKTQPQSVVILLLLCCVLTCYGQTNLRLSWRLMPKSKLLKMINICVIPEFTLFLFPGNYADSEWQSSTNVRKLSKICSESHVLITILAPQMCYGHLVLQDKKYHIHIIKLRPKTKHISTSYGRFQQKIIFALRFDVVVFLWKIPKDQSDPKVKKL